MLGFGPAPADRARDAIERREKVNFAGTVHGKTEYTPFRWNDGAREDSGFESSEERLFAETGYFAMDLDSPLSCRGLVAEHGADGAQRISHDHAALE